MVLSLSTLICNIITGIPRQGCREEHKGDGFQRDQPDWVAVTNSNYSYTRMTLHNYTHVTLQQISIDLVIMYSVVSVKGMEVGGCWLLLRANRDSSFWLGVF